MDGFWHVQGPGVGISAESESSYISDFFSFFFFLFDISTDFYSSSEES